MKKLLTILVIAAISLNIAYAQNVYSSSVKFDKSQVSGVIAEYNLSKDVIKNTLKERLDKEGLKRSGSKKGYDIYEGATWSVVSTRKLDVYMKVAGNKSKATITVLLSKGNDNFLSTTADSAEMDNVKKYLTDLATNANEYKFSLDVAAQEKVVKKAEKEYEKSIKEGKNLMSDKEKIEKKIIENSSDQKNMQQVFETAKSKLEDLKKSNH